MSILTTRWKMLAANSTAAVPLAGAVTVFAITVHAQQPAARTSELGTSAAVTAFVDVTVIPMDTERVLPGQTVLVQGGRITALGPADQVKVPAGAVRIDGRRKFLLPGLADMHAHLAGFDFSVGAQQHPIPTAERALFLYAANGVTTIRNMDHEPVDCTFGSCILSGNDLLQLRARAAAGELWSPRIYTSGPWYRQAGKWEVPLDSIEHYLRAYQAAGYDFIKPYWENGAVLDSLVSISRRLALTLQGHVHLPPGTPAGVLERAFTTYKSIEHLTGYTGQTTTTNVPLADSVEIPRLVAATRQAGVWNCPTLRSPGTQPRNSLETRYTQAELYRRYPSLADTTRKTTRTQKGPSPKDVERQNLDLNLQRRVVRELQHAGAGLLLGTDVPDSPGYYIHHELQALVQAGLTSYEALLTGTRNVAQFFGTLDSTGTVARGKRADLILLNANPLVDIRNSSQLAGVMVNGRWLPMAAIERQLAVYYPEVSHAETRAPNATPKTPE